MPLADTGGKYTYLDWLNVTTASWGNQFYTNTRVIAAYETYIATLLNHTNA